jgi:hypothetical protein
LFSSPAIIVDCGRNEMALDQFLILQTHLAYTPHCFLARLTNYQKIVPLSNPPYS